MMTALDIRDYTGGSLLRFFHHNRIRVEHLYCDSAAVKSVTYEHYRGNIGWAAIDRFVGSQRSSLLCSPDTELPEDCGYRRFESYELSRRMCENAALYLLRASSLTGVKVVLSDSVGDSLGLCEHLAEYAVPVYVVTQAADLYTEYAEYLLAEKGAALRVSKSCGCLSDADLIISPERIDFDMRCHPAAVILSGEKPSVHQNAPVIYDYFFDLPKKYRELMPEYLSEMYFASALYSLTRASELGGELFTRCGDGTVIHTRMSLTEFLKKRLISR